MPSIIVQTQTHDRHHHYRYDRRYCDLQLYISAPNASVSDAFFVSIEKYLRLRCPKRTPVGTCERDSGIIALNKGRLTFVLVLMNSTSVLTVVNGTYAFYERNLKTPLV